MENNTKEELYNNIDEDDEMTDSEKRETYYSEIDNYDAERAWEDGF